MVMTALQRILFGQFATNPGRFMELKQRVPTQGLLCNSFFGVCCSLLVRDYNILPKEERHWRFCLETFKQTGLEVLGFEFLASGGYWDFVTTITGCLLGVTSISALNGTMNRVRFLIPSEMEVHTRRHESPSIFDNCNVCTPARN